MRLVPETSPMPRLFVFPLLLLAFAGLAIARWTPELMLWLAHCPLRERTGLPCPSCGGTHAAVALAGGRLGEAFLANPLVAIGGVCFAVWALWAVAATLVPRLRRGLELGPKEKKLLKGFAILALALTWLWEVLQIGGQAA